MRDPANQLLHNQWKQMPPSQWFRQYLEQEIKRVESHLFSQRQALTHLQLIAVIEELYLLKKLKQNIFDDDILLSINEQ